MIWNEDNLVELRAMPFLAQRENSISRTLHEALTV